MEEGDLEPLSQEVLLSRHHIQTRWADRLAGRDTMFIAEVGGNLAGSVCIEEMDDFPGLLHLFALQVAPALQNRGIGSAVVAWVEGEAVRRGLAGVFLGAAEENSGARRLYERLGYKPEGLPFERRWFWEGSDGEQREIAETVQPMFKRFDLGIR
jgi:ribosomal protein S18 acetylase RimI-like enzyme